MIKINRFQKGNRAIIESQNANGETLNAVKSISRPWKITLASVTLASVLLLSSCSKEKSHEPAPTASETPTATPKAKAKTAKYDVDKAIDKIVDEDQRLEKYREYLHTDAKDVFKDITDDEYLKTVIETTIAAIEINNLTEKEGNFILPDDEGERLFAFAEDLFLAKAEANNYYGRDLVKIYNCHAPTDDEYYNGKTNVHGFISTYMMNATERLPLHWLVEDQDELRNLNILQDAIIKVNIKE